MLLGSILVGLGVLGVVLTYLGFPAFLWLTTRAGARHAGPSRLLPLRLIIPTFNEEKLIVAKIRNVLDQDYPKDLLEVVVVDDGSTDGTCQRIQQEFGKQVRVLALAQNGGKNAALNAAMERLKPHPPLVGTTDADALLTPGALRHLALALNDETVGLAAARLTYRSAAGEFREQHYFGYESWVRDLESRDACCVSIPGQLEVHRASLWEPLPTNVATDMGTALSVLSQGFGVVAVNQALVHSSTTPKALKELRRKARTIRRGLRAASWKWAELSGVARGRILVHKILRYASAGYQALVLAGCYALAVAGSQLALWAFAAQLAGYLAIGVGGIAAQRGINTTVTRPLTNLFYFQAVYATAFIELLKWFAGDVTAPEWGTARDEGVEHPALTDV